MTASPISSHLPDLVSDILRASTRTSRASGMAEEAFVAARRFGGLMTVVMPLLLLVGFLQ
jgi:hypothetical protein